MTSEGFVEFVNLLEEMVNFSKQEGDFNVLDFYNLSILIKNCSLLIDPDFYDNVVNFKYNLSSIFKEYSSSGKKVFEIIRDENKGLRSSIPRDKPGYSFLMLYELIDKDIGNDTSFIKNKSVPLLHLPVIWIILCLISIREVIQNIYMEPDEYLNDNDKSWTSQPDKNTITKDISFVKNIFKGWTDSDPRYCHSTESGNFNRCFHSDINPREKLENFGNAFEISKVIFEFPYIIKYIDEITKKVLKFIMSENIIITRAL